MRFVDDIRAAHRYGIILVLVIAQFILLSAGGEDIWVRVIAATIAAVIFVVTFLTTGLAPRNRHLVITIAVGATLAAVGSGLAGGEFTRGIVGSVSALLVLTVAVTIIRGIARLPVVNRQTILGALCVYLMIGLFFAYVYSAVSAFDSQPFFAGGRTDTLAHFVYFSYVTQATVGYGDFTAATNLGRTLAVTEALTGQLYLVTIVALVVGNLGRVRRSPQT
jgi:Ion channel